MFPILRVCGRYGAAVAIDPINKTIPSIRVEHGVNDQHIVYKDLLNLFAKEVLTAESREIMQQMRVAETAGKTDEAEKLLHKYQTVTSKVAALANTG